eukprot:CAMPEP_0185583968 /NCGR_PEP_ID=MMETSP0434-20130131/29371_1 /TAXON_ID=626734 ORGANISM="Favella taraikaensis, Strain Fe Narragansett Bay" /NCGR_SAMPLE_ID=MMETSP0434 /ASSEMBLY_ACC=CAM_ASM_000379 /LENGTH=53 /DNA_ID=CAMNT_0028203433 /DNA_START=209 /DNA_END=370 /DNA_ORIENTATION=-
MKEPSNTTLPSILHSKEEQQAVMERVFGTRVPKTGTLRRTASQDLLRERSGGL